MEYAWLVRFQQICHGKCKDIFAGSWGAITIFLNNTIIRQRGVE
jgi:hypothetical protein